VEGLIEIPMLEGKMDRDTIVAIVVVILAIFFLFQQFGTASIGRFFGPVMLLWFTLLGVLGTWHIFDNINILNAFNPYYAYRFLVEYEERFWLLGAVFLSTAGAEALYSDLGHCGRQNIRVAWVYVKIALLLNYLGQGASLLANHKGIKVTDTVRDQFGIN